jgi:hypothetical protein
LPAPPKPRHCLLAEASIDPPAPSTCSSPRPDELGALTLVHYDHDFDQIAHATGQPAIWLAPAGSID